MISGGTEWKKQQVREYSGETSEKEDPVWLDSLGWDFGQDTCFHSIFTSELF